MKIDLDSIYKAADEEYEAASEVIENSEPWPTIQYEQCRTIQYLSSCLMLIIESIQEGKVPLHGPGGDD